MDVAAESSDGGMSDASADSDVSDVCASDSTGTRFVDHALGTDDTAHGNRPGRCAFRTLTYALAHASDQISLSAQDTYKGGVDGETLPFLLTGQQGLACNGATLANEEDQGTYDGIAQFAGTRNAVTGRHFDGRRFGGYCLVVNATAADVARPHAVTGSSFTGCDNVAIVVPNSFNNVAISGNTFTLNLRVGVLRGLPHQCQRHQQHLRREHGRRYVRRRSARHLGFGQHPRRRCHRVPDMRRMSLRALKRPEPNCLL